MIRCLRGEVLNVVENAVLLDVHGMGFDVLCSRGALALCRAGERVRLTVFMQVSEAGASLFGFADERLSSCCRPATSLVVSLYYSYYNIF